MLWYFTSLCRHAGLTYPNVLLVIGVTDDYRRNDHCTNGFRGLRGGNLGFSIKSCFESYKINTAGYGHVTSPHERVKPRNWTLDSTLFEYILNYDWLSKPCTVIDWNYWFPSRSCHQTKYMIDIVVVVFHKKYHGGFTGICLAVDLSGRFKWMREVYLDINGGRFNQRSAF